MVGVARLALALSRPESFAMRAVGVTCDTHTTATGSLSDCAAARVPRSDAHTALARARCDSGRCASRLGPTVSSRTRCHRACLLEFLQPCLLARTTAVRSGCKRSCVRQCRCHTRASRRVTLQGCSTQSTRWVWHPGNPKDLARASRGAAESRRASTIRMRLPQRLPPHCAV